MRWRGHGVVEPPQELADWYLWAINHDAYTPDRRAYDMSKRPEWKRARREWFAANGWPGGEAAMLAD